MKQTIEVSSNQKVLLADNVMIQDLAGESVLLNLENEQYFGLDPVGRQMLTSLAQSESIGDSYQLLLEEFEVEPDRLRKDLDDFISKMVSYGLVKVTSS